MNMATPFLSLSESLGTLVKCLQMHIPLRIWMVTRVTGDDWNVLHVLDQEGQVQQGDVFKWSDSYCSRMVRREAPRYAPDAGLIASYRAAGINETLKIGCYIGQPLHSFDGTLLGTLCAVDPMPRPGFSDEQKFLIETAARTSSTFIAHNLLLEQARRERAELQYRAHTDPLTGLGNRHVWHDALDAEERALDSLGENAMVMIVDLDGLKRTNDKLGHDAGDRYLRAAAAILREQLREADLLARIGGDEFAVLVRGISGDEAEQIKQRLTAAFEKKNVSASIGFAMRLSHRSLDEAIRGADRKMYEEKALRQYCG